MCGGYGETDSNKDGDVTLADFFRDITDGGGAGYSGARFGGGTGSSVLDDNNDMYVSEAEYMRGQKAYEANQREGIEDGRFGNAYRDSQNILSKFSNSFGALPRGSIASEAALGSDGRDISTSRIARFMQGGGVLGALGRGLTGGNIMSPEYVSPVRGENMTPEEYDRAIVKSFNSMGNTGEEPVPQEVAAAMGRVRGLNPRAVSVAAPVPVGYDDDPILYNQIMGAYDNEKNNRNELDVSTSPNYQIRKISNNGNGGTYAVTGTNSDGTVVDAKFSGEYLTENGFVKPE
jgi:hypothetical protein